MKIEEIYEKYFKGQESHDDLEKAHYAYHAVNDPSAHRFFGAPWDHKSGMFPSEGYRQQTCTLCGRTRSEVRWDDLPAKCQAPTPNIEATLHTEESQFFELMDAAETKIPEILKKKFQGELTAKALFYLQSTTGYHPDIVACFVERDIEPLMVEYEVLMVEHQRKSGKFR